MFLGPRTGKFDMCSSLYIYCFSYIAISNWLPICKHVVHKIWGSHSSLAEDSSLLRCDAVSLDEWFPKFHINIQNHSLNQWHHHIPYDLNLYIVCILVAVSKKTYAFLWMVSDVLFARFLVLGKWPTWRTNSFLYIYL